MIIFLSFLLSLVTGCGPVDGEGWNFPFFKTGAIIVVMLGVGYAIFRGVQHEWRKDRRTARDERREDRGRDKPEPH